MPWVVGAMVCRRKETKRSPESRKATLVKSRYLTVTPHGSAESLCYLLLISVNASPNRRQQDECYGCGHQLWPVILSRTQMARVVRARAQRNHTRGALLRGPESQSVNLPICSHVEVEPLLKPRMALAALDMMHGTHHLARTIPARH